LHPRGARGDAAAAEDVFEERVDLPPDAARYGLGA
jgi:hypothetical protein